MKWYNAPETESAIISSRVRLARNLSKYPFSTIINEKACREMVRETVASVKNERTAYAGLFEFIELDKTPPLEIQSMLERHIISPMLVNGKNPRGVLVKDDESLCIMLGEEDHVRIQAIFAGDDIDSAWELADKIDDLVEETLEYAFDKDFGYLTSCPTNTGTGLRASYMLHLPLLESNGQIKNLLQTLGKFGMTIRGIYGEGSESQGSIYQVSNQLTLGKSEREIIDALKSVTSQITDAEEGLRRKVLADRKTELEDRIYRAYGILSNCRQLTVEEGMEFLSSLRLGYITGIFGAPPLSCSVYGAMMGIRPANLQKNKGRELAQAEESAARAEYIRSLVNTAAFKQVI